MPRAKMKYSTAIMVSKSNTQSDSQMLLYYSVLTTMAATVWAASLLLPTASAAVIANGANEHQQLTNEKVQLFSLHNTNNNNRHQIIANDLLEQPEAAADQQTTTQVTPTTTTSTPPTDNKLLRPQQRQLLQQSAQQHKLVSHGVINGNQATYVEPPADFKPIIYDYDKQQQRQTHKMEPVAAAAAVAQLAPSESSESINQLLPSIGSTQQQQYNNNNHYHHHLRQQAAIAPVDPLMISSSGADSYSTESQSTGDYQQQYRQQQQAAFRAQQQQHQQNQADAGSRDLEQDQENKEHSNRLDKIDTQVASSGEGASVMVKPSIGRWRDWHDMSIEPDLASSDSSPRLYSVQQPQQTQYASAVPPALMRTRYKQAENMVVGGDYVPATTNTMPPTTKILQQPYWSWVIHQPMPQAIDIELEEQQRLERAVSFDGQNIGRIMLMGNEQQQQQQEQVVDKRPTNMPQFQIKGVQPAIMIISPTEVAAAAPSVPLPPTTSGPIKGIKLPLNLISSPNNLTKMQQQQQQQQQQVNEQHNQNQPSFWHSSWKQIHPIPVQESNTAQWGQKQQQHQKQKQQQHPQRRLKRRRKSKTNAEVRIQQLVAASQQQHQQRQQELSVKQVNGLTTTTTNTNQQQHPKQHVDQENQPQLMAAQVNSDDVVDDDSVHQRQQVSEKRVSSSRQPQHWPTSTSVVFKRFGNIPLAPNHGNSSTSTTGVALARQLKPRVVKRRRVKTLLPVGLSSWFLGGMRDLDGRHWQLPVEVMSRLAINDVDFHNQQQQPKVGPPAAGSVIMIADHLPTTHVGVGSSIPQLPPLSSSSSPVVSEVTSQTMAQRVPISQLIPRR